MVNQEFSSEFDILFNSIMSNQAPSVSEYEKSVFLTQAQEELVIAIHTGRLNGEPFDSTEEIRSYIQELVKTVGTQTKLQGGEEIDDDSTIFLIPEDVWFIVYEQVSFNDPAITCNKDKKIRVKPVQHDHFDKIKDNPFKGPNKNRVLRLSLNSNSVELVSKYNIHEYKLRYLRRPDPIILEDLSPYGLSINGESDEIECKLNSSIHRLILNRAVDLARATWQ